MQTFEEGRLQLQFPADWAVLKYDDGRYYRGTIGRTGAALAAVDFVAVPPAAVPYLLLLEVKDFRNHEVANRPRLAKGELATEVATKAFHTLGALCAGVRAKQAELRLLAAGVQPLPETVQVVLLLEQDEPPLAGMAGHLSTRAKLKRDTYLEYQGKLLTDLHTKLKPFRLQVAVYTCATVPASLGWRAVARP